MPTQLINYENLGKKLNVSKTQARRIASSDGFPERVTIGGSVRFDEAEVDRWIRKQRKRKANRVHPD